MIIKIRLFNRKLTSNDLLLETEMVSRETLEASVTESQARITIFVRSMTPYVQSHVEISKSTKEFSQLSFVKATQINQNQINQWGCVS